MAGDDLRQKEVVLGSKEIDPEEEARYRGMIDQARKTGVGGLKGRTPVGGVERPQIPVMQRTRQVVPEAPDFPSPNGQRQQQGVTPRPPGSPVLTAETVRQIEEAQKVAQQAPAEEKLDEKKIVEESPDLAEFLSGFNNSSTAVERILDNPKRRKEIEDRCAPMNFEDLLIRDEVRQMVPIIPGKFEPMFRSISPQESLFIKKKLADAPIQSNQYVGELYQLYVLTCGLYALNGEPLPPHTNQDGDVDEQAFDKKFKKVIRKSAYILADLSLNYGWFDIRVRKLINPDDLKNG